jgi:hypothetical protein
VRPPPNDQARQRNPDSQTTPDTPSELAVRSTAFRCCTPRFPGTRRSTRGIARDCGARAAAVKRGVEPSPSRSVRWHFWCSPSPQRFSRSVTAQSGLRNVPMQRPDPARRIGAPSDILASRQSFLAELPTDRTSRDRWDPCWIATPAPRCRLWPRCSTVNFPACPGSVTRWSTCREARPRSGRPVSRLPASDADHQADAHERLDLQSAVEQRQEQP